MKTLLQAPFMKEFIRMLDNMYRLGWHERNSGNASYLLYEEDIKPYKHELKLIKTIVLEGKFPILANRYFLVTGTTKYFKNALELPEDTVGIIKINEQGNAYDILWGYSGTGKPTSELPTHLATHAVKLELNPKHRMVLHAHATHTLAMSFTHDLDEKLFTKTLWKMSTECIVVFPEGVGVLPWMVCGNKEIADETAIKMHYVNAVIWSLHGMFAAGNTMDETFGLIETIEKSATIYHLTSGLGVKQDITDNQLMKLANAFNVTPRADILHPTK